jgi:hypothetical protein
MFNAQKKARNGWCRKAGEKLGVSKTCKSVHGNTRANQSKDKKM